jgi:hypothetical protein
MKFTPISSAHSASLKTRPLKSPAVSVAQFLEMGTNSLVGRVYRVSGSRRVSASNRRVSASSL